MAVAPQVSYPGVYIQEVDSGVRTIVGLPTAITAFIGRTKRGPINEPTLITNLGQFNTLFGGLAADCPLTYAVNDYYLNGGSQAIIVRLYEAGSGGGTSTAVTTAQQALETAKTNAAAVSGSDAETASQALQTAVTAAQADPEVSAAQTKLNTVSSAVPLDPAAVTRAATDLATVQSTFIDPTSKKTLGTLEDELEAALADVPDVRKAQAALEEEERQLLFSQNGLAATPDGELNIVAASNGSWGNGLTITLDQNGISDALAQKYNGDGATKDSLFNLRVADAAGGVESITNVAIEPNSRRRLDRVLEQESLLIRIRPKSASDPDPDLPTAIPNIAPDGTSFQLTGGADSAALSTTTYTGDAKRQTGLFALEKADLFTLLCIPPDERRGDTSSDVYKAAMAYCTQKRAMLIIDPPMAWGKIKETAAQKALDGYAALGYGGQGDAARNAAIYFPRVVKGDPLRENQPDVFVPCGIIAGIMARIDGTRGIWKAPAGIEATLNGIRGLQVNLGDGDSGRLNPLGINVLRNFRAYGNVVWGARTTRGADQMADDYKYVPVRRLVMMIEETLYRNTQWAVFEPNDEPLWAQLRLNIGAFMHDLFRQGAFQGSSPKDAYFVKCDAETTTQSDINKGIVNIQIGFAPLKPAEFVVIYIQQIAGNIDS